MNNQPANKWDLYFLNLAYVIASNSKDPSTKCGAIIVRPDKTICSTGYNGFARGMKDDPDLYNNREIKYSRIIHAEMSSLCFARENVEGYTLYTVPAPCCDRCCVCMIQAGIKRFVWAKPSPDYLSRWGETFERTKSYLAEIRGMRWTEVDFNSGQSEDHIVI